MHDGAVGWRTAGCARHPRELIADLACRCAVKLSEAPVRADESQAEVGAAHSLAALAGGRRSAVRLLGDAVDVCRSGGRNVNLPVHRQSCVEGTVSRRGGFDER